MNVCSLPGSAHQALSLAIVTCALVACSGTAPPPPTAPAEPASTSTSTSARTDAASDNRSDTASENRTDAASDNSAAAASANNEGVRLADMGKKDEAAARFKKACIAGSQLGCFNLHTAVVMARARVFIDEEGRTALYTRAIRGSDPTFSAEAGHLFREGIGMPKDEKRAAAIYEKACERGSAEGCYRLGLMLMYGQGVTQDRTRAETLFSNACKGGEHNACVAHQVLRESSSQ